MPVEDRIAARLLEALAGLDLTSADGRAGIGTLKPRPTAPGRRGLPAY